MTRQNSPSNKAPTILLVEDDPMAVKVAELNLKSAGAILDIADTAETALLMIQRCQYDLILMDIGLPDTDGYILTEKIRALGYKDVPIVGLSAHIDEAHQKRCHEAGMNAVYLKPLMPNMIMKILGEIH